MAQHSPREKQQTCSRLAAHGTKRLPGNGGICVFVKDVDLVYVDLVSRGAK